MVGRIGPPWLPAVSLALRRRRAVRATRRSPPMSDALGSSSCFRLCGRALTLPPIAQNTGRDRVLPCRTGSLCSRASAVIPPSVVGPPPSAPTAIATPISVLRSRVRMRLAPPLLALRLFGRITLVARRQVRIVGAAIAAATSTSRWAPTPTRDPPVRTAVQIAVPMVAVPMVAVPMVAVPMVAASMVAASTIAAPTARTIDGAAARATQRVRRHRARSR